MPDKLLVLDKIVDAYKEYSGETSISKNAIRGWVLGGKVRSVNVGRRRLISLNSLISFLENPQQDNSISKLRVEE